MSPLKSIPGAPTVKLGIIGGGQLAKMMAFKAKKFGFYVRVLDPSPDAPAVGTCDDSIVANFSDHEKLQELVRSVDVTTFDLEHVDVGEIRSLEVAGHVIHPSTRVLEIIQDKASQKELFKKYRIPTSPFVVLDHPTAQTVAQFGFPLVQKLRRGGYDGRGVAILKTEKDLSKMLQGPSILEKWVDIRKELAVMVARDIHGKIASHAVVEMKFDSQANILDVLLAPAKISSVQSKKATDLAIRAVKALGGVGIFGVEMLLSKKGELIINEIAPRPHNSGHYTMEASVTCQFEQHIRAITGLPLGDPRLIAPAAMFNLLGAQGESGPSKISGLQEALSIPGVSVHIYGKAMSSPFRKMGHVTAIDQTLKKAEWKAMKAKKRIRIGANSSS